MFRPAYVIAGLVLFWYIPFIHFQLREVYMSFDPEIALKALEFAIQENLPIYQKIETAQQYYYFLTGSFPRHPSEITKLDQEV